jgi:uncharacterized protein YjbI with pentapeptide repeats
MGRPEQDEPFARAPRLVKFGVYSGPGEVDVEDGRWSVRTALIDDGPDLFRESAVVDLELCNVRNTSLGDPLTLDGRPPRLVDAYRCDFDVCDLSGDRFRSVRQTRFVGCGFTGSDFGAAELIDVVFERCVFRLASFRMARLERVRFEDCHLSNVDAFELDARDVSFDGSRLDRLGVDRLRATNVDFRGASELSFEGVGRLDGCLVAGTQLHSLVDELAAAVGLEVDHAS